MQSIISASQPSHLPSWDEPPFSLWNATRLGNRVNSTRRRNDDAAMLIMSQRSEVLVRSWLATESGRQTLYLITPAVQNPDPGPGRAAPLRPSPALAPTKWGIFSDTDLRKTPVRCPGRAESTSGRHSGVNIRVSQGFIHHATLLIASLLIVILPTDPLRAQPAIYPSRHPR